MTQAETKEWVTNLAPDDFADFAKHNRFKLVVGPPKATPTHSKADLARRGLLGAYRISK